MHPSIYTHTGKLFFLPTQLPPYKAVDIYELYLSGRYSQGSHVGLWVEGDVQYFGASLYTLLTGSTHHLTCYPEDQKKHLNNKNKNTSKH